MNKMLDLWNYLTLQLTMSITTKIQLNLTVAARRIDSSKCFIEIRLGTIQMMWSKNNNDYFVVDVRAVSFVSSDDQAEEMKSHLYFLFASNKSIEIF